jgi:hypothetical protein
MTTHFGFHDALVAVQFGLLAKSPMRKPELAFQNFYIILSACQYWLSQRYSGSTSTLPLIASRPSSILKPIESRLVNVISIGHCEVPICVCITYRCSLKPLNFNNRLSTKGASQ